MRPRDVQSRRYTPPTTHPESLRELLARQAALRPEAQAILAPGGEPLSYSGLLEQVDYCAEALGGVGLGRGERVAMVLPEGPEAAVAFLGLASATGCAPLNPSYQEAEFEYYFSDLGVRALVLEDGSGSPASKAARRLGIPVIELKPCGSPGLFRLMGAEEEPAPVGLPAGPGDEALVLHTSGTTSRPKVVPLSQANLCHSASTIARGLELTEGDRCLNVMPLFHVHGLMASLLASLAAGASVVCAPGFSAERFFGWVAELEPTWYTAVPAMHRAVLARWQANRALADSCRLRFVRSCSAPLPISLMEELERVFRAPVIEAYGMTEATHQIASNPLPPASRKPGSVGLATGCRVAIMDPQGSLLRPGETGEVVVRGGGVTSGYENNPEANRSAFSDGWFRTGDLGFLDEEGYLFLSGRLKEIINRGGEKVSPREVEEVILGHPSVAEAVAFAVASPEMGEEVAAAVVPRPGSDASERELLGYAAERLAYFKVPRRVVFLEELPKGPTGKLQRVGFAERMGLSAESLRPPASTGPKAAPASELEERLARIWSEVLGVEGLGVEENFFELGGDSILGAHLVARTQETLGISLPLAFLFIAPTVRGLAEAVEGRELPGEWPSLVPMKAGGSRPPLFCVHPHGGQVLVYLDLVRRLGPEQPVFGFQRPEADGREAPASSLEELASGYVEEMVGLQPEGPYYVAGYCSGGPIAFEMARQLEASGREVALLALIDSYAPGSPEPLPEAGSLAGLLSSGVDYFHRVRAFLQYLSLLGPRQKVRHLRGLLPSVSKEVLRAGFRFRGRGLPRFLKPEEGSVRALLEAYRPEVFQGPTVLFRPTKEPPGHRRDELMGWGPLVAGPLDVVEVPGYYRTLIFRPKSRLLAERFGEKLRAAQDKGGGR